MGEVAGLPKAPTNKGKEVDIVAVSKKQQASVNKYVKSNYDRINVTMPKGKKDIIKAHAESRGESVNEFINKAIDQRIEAEHN
jgi:hypothetical protein